MNKTSFQDSMLYPIVFMLITCIVFVGVLAVMFRSSEAKIDAYKRNTYQQMVLGLFIDTLATRISSSPQTIMADYPKSYDTYITQLQMQELKHNVFAASVDKDILGYCFDIGGKGLWGSMRALIALSPDFATLNGMMIYEQMETPGLGARIGEQWFLDQFKGVPIIDANSKSGSEASLVNFELIPEGKQAENPTQIQQITGATITSSSVIKMLRDEIGIIQQSVRKNNYPIGFGKQATANPEEQL